MYDQNVSDAGSRVTVRIAQDSDARALVRLAVLDCAEVPAGPTLLAEVDGEVAAALAVGGGCAVADPFRRTEALIALLELRAAQLRDESRPRWALRARLLALARAPLSLR